MPQLAAVAACTLPRSGRAERAARWRQLARDADTSARLTVDGVELRYRRTPAARAELEGLAGAERVCCPFAAWSVRVEPAVLVLTVTLTAADTAPLTDSAAELSGVTWRA